MRALGRFVVVALVVTLVGATSGLVAPPGAAAAPAGTFTFFERGVSGPGSVVVGPDNNLWFTNAAGNAIGRITAAGVLTLFAAATISAPQDIAAGPDGNLWFTNSGNDSIGRITPSGVVTNVTDPAISAPAGITVGPDNNLWFTNGGNDSIGRLTTAGVITAFPGAAGGRAITAGPDGNVWFAGPGQVGRATPAGAITLFPASIYSNSVDAITAGPDGNLWITSPGFSSGSVVRMTTSGQATAFPVADKVPTGIVSGLDGRLWFANSVNCTRSGCTPGSIGQITTSGTVTDTSFAVPPFGDPRSIAVGPDGNYWFTDGATNSIGRMTPAGATARFGSMVNQPEDITSGPDGNLWFTNALDDTIGRVTTSGVVTTFPGPGISHPSGIARGADGNLWFTNPGNHTIGRITPGGSVANFTDAALSGPRAITAGPDGNLWFANSDRVGRITTAGTVTTFAVGLSIFDQVGDLASGPDGNLWFTVPSQNTIGRLSPSGTATLFPLTDFSPSHITAGPDGNLWFTNATSGNERVGKITTNGSPTLYATPVVSTLDIATGPDGNLWATSSYEHTIVRFTPSGQATSFDDPSVNGAQGITAGPDGNLWFANTSGSSIGRLSVGLPDAPAAPTAVAGDSSASVSWAAPSSDGGSAITSYKVTASPGGNTCTWSAGPLVCAVTGLTPGVPYTFTVRATNAAGTGPASPPSTPTIPAGLPPKFFATTPNRLLDSRDGTGGFSTPWTAGLTRNVAVAGGTTTVPIGATSVVLNVTGFGATSATHLTLWPTGEAMPVASNLNLPAGGVRPNLVEVRVGASGQVSIFNNAGTIDVIADVVGYHLPAGTGTAAVGRAEPTDHAVVPTADPGSLFTALQPKRLLDSRDNTGGFNTPWAAGQIRDLTVTGGSTTVPVGATAVVLNMTATQPTSTSHLTVWPQGANMPVASNLNFGPGQTVANLVVAKVSDTGQLSIFNNSGFTHVIADVVGYFAASAGSVFTGVQPTRLLDSRDGTGGYFTPWLGGESRDLAVVGNPIVPANAVAVVLNVTAVFPSGSTHLTVWPAGDTMPVASNLNVPAGDVRPNLVVAKVGAGGKVSIFNNAGTAHVIADVVGFYT